MVALSATPKLPPRFLKRLKRPEAFPISSFLSPRRSRQQRDKIETQTETQNRTGDRDDMKLALRLNSDIIHMPVAIRARPIARRILGTHPLPHEHPRQRHNQKGGKSSRPSTKPANVAL